eukprot:GEMP01005249.1.p1 GENE.GEMP01005249.1~~GEMP01005249.1.p1  ORF type:complete len:1152 (+),score=263.59 GEMP01005249.1:94-3549(+)
MICGVCDEPIQDACTAMCGCTFCLRHACSTFKLREEPPPTPTRDIDTGSVVILPHGSAAVVHKRDGDVLLVSSSHGRTRVLVRDVERSPWLSNLKTGDLVSIPSIPGHGTAGAVIACHSDGMIAVETYPEGYVWEGPLGSISPYTKLSLDPFSFPPHVPNGKFADAFEGMEHFDYMTATEGWSASAASNSREREDASSMVQHAFEEFATQLPQYPFTHPPTNLPASRNHALGLDPARQQRPPSSQPPPVTVEMHRALPAALEPIPRRPPSALEVDAQPPSPALEVSSQPPSSALELVPRRPRTNDPNSPAPSSSSSSRGNVGPVGARRARRDARHLGDPRGDADRTDLAAASSDLGNAEAASGDHSASRSGGTIECMGAWGGANFQININVNKDAINTELTEGHRSPVEDDTAEMELEPGTPVRLIFARALLGLKYGVGRVAAKRDHIGIVRARRADGSYTVHFPSARNAHFCRRELETVEAPREGSMVHVSPNFQGHRAGKLSAHAVGKLVSVNYEGSCLVDFGEFYRDLQFGDRTKLWRCQLSDLVEDDRSENDPVFPLPKCPLCKGAMGEVIRSDMAIAANNFNCGICGDILADPVTLGCGHSFCHMELQLWFRCNDTCPICRERFPSLGATVQEKVILRRFMHFPGNGAGDGRGNSALFERKERVVLHAIHKMRVNKAVQIQMEDKYGGSLIFERRLSVHADAVSTILKTQDDAASIVDRFPFTERIIDYFSTWGADSMRGLLQTGLTEKELLEPVVKNHTMLMLASQSSLDTVNSLLDMSAVVEYYIADGAQKGFSALSCAAAAGKTDIVQVLADLTPKSRFPVAIREAMKAGHGQLALCLRERLSAEDSEQNDCRRSCAVLACRLGDVDLLSRFVEYFDDPMWERSEDAEPEAKFAEGGSLSELDSDFGRPNTVPDFISRQTPLEACSSKHCVKYLLRRTAMTSTPTSTSLPCHSACASIAPYTRFSEVLDAYVEGGFDINALDIDGRSALFFIWRSGYDDARARLEVLLERGANCCVRDKEGRQVLHLAAAKGDIGVFEALIGCSQWAVDDRGQSPLHVACRFGRKGFVDHILTCKSPRWDLKKECARRDVNDQTAYALLPQEIRNTDVGEALRAQSAIPKRERPDGDDSPPSRRYFGVFSGIF